MAWVSNFHAGVIRAEKAAEMFREQLALMKQFQKSEREAWKELRKQREESTNAGTTFV